jgi:hypothetical protein
MEFININIKDQPKPIPVVYALQMVWLQHEYSKCLLRISIKHVPMSGMSPSSPSWTATGPVSSRQ